MLVSADLLVRPAEFKPITDAETVPDVLRWNGEVALSSRDKLMRWQEWYKKQRPM